MISVFKKDIQFLFEVVTYRNIFSYKFQINFKIKELYLV